MVVWTPKHPMGIQTQWKGPPSGTTFEEGNMLVYSTEIKQERVINLENVYRYMHHWLKEEGWKSVHGNGKSTWVEDYYAESRNQHGEKEIRWWWRTEKQHAGIAGGNQYFRYKWYIDVMCLHMKQIEIMYKGKKIKPYMGEFIMWFNAILELDIHNWFVKGSSFGLGDVLSDFFIRIIFCNHLSKSCSFNGRILPSLRKLFNPACPINGFDLSANDSGGASDEV